MGALGGIERQRDPHQPGVAGFGSNDFQLAMMGLDDFSADGQAQAQANVARGEKRRGCFLDGFGCKAGPIVLHLDLQSWVAVAA